MNHVSTQLSSHSRFMQRTQRRYGHLLGLLPLGLPNIKTIEKTYGALIGVAAQAQEQTQLEVQEQAQEQEKGERANTTLGAATAFTPDAALRILRQLIVHRLCSLNTVAGDFVGGDAAAKAVSLEEITLAMTAFAEFALNTACTLASAELDARHGAPLCASGAPCELWTIGMGKLGARELNVSSDIDIIFVYQEDGHTRGLADGRGLTSNAEYFAKLVRMVSNLIADVSEHGFVFRVDLALRPNGNSGPAAISLRGLETYFQVQGREWERFAWLKSRVLAPWPAVESGSAGALRGLVLPFVFRRYLDYAVFDSLRSLHQQIRSHAAQRAAGRPERANDVKLSRGGIREIEFIVQLLQVVRGGQFPELRTRPTLGALLRLAKAGLIPEEKATQLARAYRFLRELEHRIQYLDDQQTHILPTDDADLAWVAASLGFESTGELLVHLGEVRETVAKEFDLLLGAGSGSVADSSSSTTSSGNERACRSCAALGVSKSDTKLYALDPVASDWGDWLEARTVATQAAAEAATQSQSIVLWLQSVADWCKGARIQNARDETRLRLMRLCADITERVVANVITVQAAQRWLSWMETLIKRESYLALLIERPAVQERLLRLLGAAKWPLRFLTKYPGTIDELASDWMVRERFNATQFTSELEARRESLRITQEDDEETVLNVLRRAHHAELLRTLVRDLEGAIGVEQVADDLSLLADTVLEITARWCWQRLKQRHRETPQFGIIGYGKLGGKELGYGSDLDIVFVFDDEHEQAQEIYGAFVRKLINWLSVKTGEGDLFEIDTALRPNGNSGLLVTSMAAYEKYQLSNGSNTAWTWEHQAITRARFVVGLPQLQARFDDVRRKVISAPRDQAALAEEIATMRERVRSAHPVRPGVMDVKHSLGGMVDAEFAVQYLVLAHASRCSALQGNLGNIALLIEAEKQGYLASGVGYAAATAYRHLRQSQHYARLQELPAQVPQGELGQDFAAIACLYRAVLHLPKP